MNVTISKPPRADKMDFPERLRTVHIESHIGRVSLQESPAQVHLATRVANSNYSAIQVFHLPLCIRRSRESKCHPNKNYTYSSHKLDPILSLAVAALLAG